MKSANLMFIDEIGQDAQGHLFVRPLAASTDEFAYIWRDASGIRWNSQLQVLHAAEPTRWVTADLYRQIISAVKREYGIRLQATPSTRWSGIPDDLRAASLLYIFRAMLSTRPLLDAYWHTPSALSPRAFRPPVPPTRAVASRESAQ